MVIPSEPTFTLRASHAGTADCLNQHAQTAKDLGASADYIASVQQAVEAFRAWPVSVAPGAEAPPVDNKFVAEGAEHFGAGSPGAPASEG